MALLTTQTISLAGVTPSYTAVSASDTFTAGQNTFIHIKNGGGSSDSAVFSVQGSDPPGGLTISDVTVSVTNGQERMIGPFPPAFFAAPSTGLVTVTNSFTTSVTAGVFDLSRQP